jgi:hypothetical protein
MLIVVAGDKVTDPLRASWIPAVLRAILAVLLLVPPTREPGVVGNR